MLKRLIEVALPLKEVSEQSAREKSIRHGHISTLHIWWARRPLAACRAAVFASLIPDPDDPECPDHFRKLVMETLGRTEFRPKNGDGSTIEDTLRNRCLEFIKQLVKWENSNNPQYIEPARELIAAAHKFLHPDSESDAPKVLDPFAGGGAIPLEALRLGCEAHAVDLNPVAHLIELCTLVYPQKYGQPNSRPVPDYIKRLISHNKVKERATGEPGLFDNEESVSAPDDNEIIPDVEITEEEYRKNPLAADVKYWGYWVLKASGTQIKEYYPTDLGGDIPVAYLWARTVKSPDPTIDARIPLVRQLWLCKRKNRKVALRLVTDLEHGCCEFSVVEGERIDFDPDDGTMRRADTICPFTGTIAPVNYLRQEALSGYMGEQLMAVVTGTPSKPGKRYRSANQDDVRSFQAACTAMDDKLIQKGKQIVPDESIKKNARGQISPPLWGFDEWGKLFNRRQLYSLTTLVDNVRRAIGQLSSFDPDYARAVGTMLAVILDRQANQMTTLCRMDVTRETLQGTYSRQALPMVWDYAEVNPMSDATGGWLGALEWVYRVILECSKTCAERRTGHDPPWPRR